jgi:radical SAM protein with 4Fe4S-binding SPASM domain
MEQFYFILTEQCNLSCTHCIRESSPHRDEKCETPVIKEALLDIKTTFPMAQVLLSGGEPTIYHDFDEILKSSLDLGLKITINSNGLTPFFSIENLKRWIKYPNLSIQISLDGIEKVHDSIRGVGTYKNVLKTLTNLNSMNISSSVSCTVVNLNFFDEVDEFLVSLDHLDLKYISIKRATYAGRASSGMTIDTLEWNKHIYNLRNQQYKNKIVAFPMYDFDVLDRISDEALSTIKLSNSAINCGAGTAKVYIYPNGDVCSCTCFKNFPMGNLYEQSIDKIIKQPFQIEVEDETCEKCRYFAICKGGCLGSGYQYNNILGKADPRCPKIYSNID